MSTDGIIFVGYDSDVPLQLADINGNAELDQMTYCEVTVGSVTKSSDTDPGLFDLSEKATGKITLKWGTVTDLVEGTHNVRVVVFDAVNTEGQPWVHEDIVIPFKLKVIKDD